MDEKSCVILFTTHSVKKSPSEAILLNVIMLLHLLPKLVLGVPYFQYELNPETGMENDSSTNHISIHVPKFFFIVRWVKKTIDVLLNLQEWEISRMFIVLS